RALRGMEDKLGGRLVKPAAWYALLGAAALLGTAWAFTYHGDVLLLLPWGHAVAPVTALLFAAALETRLASRRRVARAADGVVTVALGLLGAVGMLAPPEG